jgi:septal ring factor EnvC (AmiA/AmiB activator)
MDPEFCNVSFPTKAEPDISKVVDDMREILLFLLEKETKALDRDLSMLNQEIHSVKRNFMDLVQEIKVEISDNLKGSEKQVEAIEVFQKVHNLADKLDAINEMSEEASIRLQMKLDRQSKFTSTLSNLMKKISTTQDTLVQNLK